MTDELEKILIITTKVHVASSLKDKFIDWTSKLNSTIAGFPGFVSLEVLSPTDPSQQKWSIIQKFSNSESVNQWRQSKSRQSLIEELTHLLGTPDSINIEEVVSGLSQQQGGVTERWADARPSGALCAFAPLAVPTLISSLVKVAVRKVAVNPSGAFAMALAATGIDTGHILCITRTKYCKSRTAAQIYF